jgi:hypothetical protein
MPIPLGVLAVAGAGAAGGGGAYDLLETQVLGTTAASVTFTGLGSYSEYKHLQLRAVTRDTNAAANLYGSVLRFNSDTGSNYSEHFLNGTGSAVNSSASTSQTSIFLEDFSPGGTSAANAFGAIVLDILDFSNTNKNKTIRSMQGATVSGESDIILKSGLWMNTAAITSFSLAAVTAYATGSRFSLYGIK